MYVCDKFQYEISIQNIVLKYSYDVCCLNVCVCLLSFHLHFEAAFFSDTVLNLQVKRLLSSVWSNHGLHVPKIQSCLLRSTSNYLSPSSGNYWK